MTYIGGIACTQEVMDLCARAGIYPEVDVRPASQVNRIFELLDASNESGKRFVLDIAGSLGSEVSTAPPTRLGPAPLLTDSLREIAVAVMGRLTALSDGSRRPAESPGSEGGGLPMQTGEGRRPPVSNFGQEGARGARPLFGGRQLLQFDL